MVVVQQCVSTQDEEAELLAELARIRKEREQEAVKKEAEAEKSRQQALQEEVIHGNPLYRQAQADFQVGSLPSCHIKTVILVLCHAYKCKLQRSGWKQVYPCNRLRDYFVDR